MSTFDYLETRADADELIFEFGQTVALRRRSTTGGTAWEPTESTTDTDTMAAIFDYETRQIDGVNVLATDRRALVSVTPLVEAGVTEINPPDALVINGVAVPIVRAKTVAPAGIPVVFDCQLRY